ncbi:sensor histidine kinase [Lachnotalea glycerini]|uniref:HAMP domain-containing protein n=1 Tax=Lachnotalea glycerini TaxID=1763509 RepID=A0A371JK41_9FIRM|nr:histidine kinase [Lachnotalea glycerini]RDY33077.1 hypothetical protein CG710_000685 [Lachnotalea glycerini]
MQKKKSFIRKIMLYLLVLTGLLIVALGGFLISSYGILNKEIKDSSNTFLEIYSNELSNNIAELDQILTSVTMQREDLEKLKRNNENERLLSSIALQQYMQSLISDNGVTDIIVVYDSNYDICLDAIKTGFHFQNKNSIRDYTKLAFENKTTQNFKWDFIYLDNERYLCKMFLTDSRVIAVYIRTSKLLDYLDMQNNGNRSIALVSNTGMIGKLWGYEKKDINEGGYISKINLNNYYTDKKMIVDGQLTIYCYTGKTSVFQQVHSSMIVVAITVCIAVLFMLFILRYTQKDIAVPMKLMVNDMTSIREGEYQKRIQGEFNTKEFQLLQETTNQMVDEIIGLKIQTYEKRIELQDMELKSIRLQLKPHFFLNALTTISSLNSQNKNEQVKMYIDSLSKNVRYMFRAGFHTVSIKEEVRHVKNYFEMQELKYPECIFYLIDLPQELEEWKIPQMLIHTFVENEYKHAISMGKILTILIKVCRQYYKGENTLLIEIEDDGKGYSKEVLDYMNGHTKNISEKGNRIGLWSIKRLMELMYERNDLVMLENINPHGCLNKIYVPENPKHELEEETIQIKI